MNADKTSGENISYWLDTEKAISFQTLSNNAKTDVLVIGGGIAGLTIAYCLLQSGRKVMVIEDGEIGSGESGRTTAHLTNALDDRYFEIESLFGKDKSKLVAQSHTEAIDFIEATIKKEQIECDFERLNGYLFLHPSDKQETLDKELEATHNAGLATQSLSSVPQLPPEMGNCIEFPAQAQFHIMKYLNGLAKAITTAGGEIFTQTRAIKIREDGADTNGYTITASKIVVATNSPVNDVVTMHTKQYPFRTYVLGFTISKGMKHMLWWDTGDQNSKWFSMPYHYARLQDYNDQHDLLIVGGEDHKTGQADAEDIPEEERYTALETWARKHFPAAKEIMYQWSGQVMEPLDSLAFIGKNPGDDNIYIVTGDSGNGMTHGTLAGIMLKDMLNGVDNVYADLYKPTRIPLKAIDTYVSEALNMAGQYADWFTGGDVDSAKDIQPGEGAIIRSGLQKLAVYKDEKGNVQAYSAVCPHLGCVVKWNGDEKTFDCPCHGSRFSHEGKVMNGPSLSDLKKISKE